MCSGPFSHWFTDGKDWKGIFLIKLVPSKTHQLFIYLIFRTIFRVFCRLMRRQAVKFMTKKKASYADINVDDFYTETVSGAGGPPKGLERDLITKFFGDGDFHGHGDHEADCLYQALTEHSLNVAGQTCHWVFHP